MILRIIIFVATALVLWLLPQAAQSFDLAGHDPWYYQSTSRGIKFLIPDKAQHCWGSALLNEFGKAFDLPAKRVTTPLITLAAGFMYEVWQEQQGVGFSERDLMANALGIVTSEFSSKNLIFYMDYSARDKVITFNVVHLFSG